MAVKRNATSADRRTASIRAACKRADRCRAAPAVRKSSKFVSSGGAVIALSVAIRPTTIVSSISEYPHKTSILVITATDTLGGHDSVAVRWRPSLVLKSSLLLLGAVRLRHGDRDLLLKLQKVLFAHSPNIHQLLDFLERPIFLAVLDYPRRSFRADPWQGLQIGC